MKNTFRFLGILLVAGAMLFASCEKDDDNSKTNATQGGNGGTQTSIAANTLVYDGQTYTFGDVVVDYYHSELTLLSAFTNDTLENGDPRLSVGGIHITPNAWNQTMNLADASRWPEEVMVGLHFSGVLDIQWEAWANDGVLGSWGSFEGVDYENETIFTSGTYSVSGNNDGTPITVTIDGTLKNGKTLRMKIVSGNYDLH